MISQFCLHCPRVQPRTEWTIPAFSFPAEAGTHLPTPEGWKAELAWVSTVHPHTKFQRNQAMRGWVVDDKLINKFSSPDFQWGDVNETVVLRGEYSDLTTPNSFRFQIYCSVSKRRRLRGDWGRKLRGNFALFHSVKLRGRVGEMVRVSFFVINLGPNLRYSFWWEPLPRSEGLEGQ